MLSETTARPDATEYAPDFEKYTSLVPEGDVIDTLSRQLEVTLSTLRGLTEAQGNSRYEPGKWSIKELVGHMIDSERIFAHRVLHFARNDQSPLPGFEQDDYVLAGNFGKRQLSDLADEFEGVRRATLTLLRSLDDEAWLRRGTANDNEASVRALAHIIAGHETHHLKVLRARYL